MVGTSICIALARNKIRGRGEIGGPWDKRVGDRQEVTATLHGKGGKKIKKSISKVGHKGRRRRARLGI